MLSFAPFLAPIKVKPMNKRTRKQCKNTLGEKNPSLLCCCVCQNCPCSPGYSTAGSWHFSRNWNGHGLAVCLARRCVFFFPQFQFPGESMQWWTQKQTGWQCGCWAVSLHSWPAHLEGYLTLCEGQDSATAVAVDWQRASVTQRCSNTLTSSTTMVFI